MISAAMATPVQLGIASLVRRLSLAFALSVSIALPAAFFYLTYSDLAEHVETLAKVKAGELNDLASGNPNLWQYNLVRIAEILQRGPFVLADERATVRDIAGNALYEAGERLDRLDAPVLTRSFPIYDFGRVVGRVDISHSYRKVVFITLLAALLGLLLGVVVYAAAMLPLRALQRTSVALAAEQASLRASEEHYRALFDHASDGIMTFTPDGRLVTANAAFAQMHGYSVDEVLAINLNDLNDPKTRHLIGERIQRILAGGAPLAFEVEHYHKDGHLFPLEVTTNLMKSEGKPLIQALHRDISERRQREAERERLLNIINDATDFISTSDMGGCILSLNTAGARMVGLPAGVDIRTLKIINFHPEWAARKILEEAIPTVLKKGSWQGESALLHLDGHEIPTSQMVLVHRDAFGEPIYMSTIIRDITEQERATKKIQVGEARLAEAQHVAHIGSWDLDLVIQKLDWSEETYKLFDQSSKNFTPSFDEFAKRVHPDDRETMQTCFDLALESDDSPYHVAVRIINDSGREWVMEAFGAVRRDIDGKPLSIYGTAQDITERKQMEELVHQMAFHDTLTKLPNRRLLDNRLSQSMAASKRSGFFGALMFLDLDEFKSLNDTHGHTVGDLLLIEVAERLKSCVREVDTVARFGGDEFVVLISDLSMDRSEATAKARIIAEKIDAALGEPYVLKLKHNGQADATVEHGCTVSIGVTLFVKNETSQEDILKQSDTAMYAAKEAGRNLIRFYSPGV